MSEQSEPCPFCGSENVCFTPDEVQYDELSTETGFIWCHGCGFSSDSFISERVAALRWNRRAPSVHRIGYDFVLFRRYDEKCCPRTRIDSPHECMFLCGKTREEWMTILLEDKDNE